MKEIIQWLTLIEASFGSFYEEAANAFSSDKELTVFLRRLADDERYHHETLLEADESLETLPSLSCFRSLDEDPMTKVHLGIAACRKELDRGCLTRETLLDCVADIEFAEWNEVFQYVINSLKETSREFIPFVASIQHHKRYVERFIQSQSGSKRFIENIRRLPSLWRENLLVVDDSVPTAYLLSEALSSEGAVECASNGKEALEKLAKRYFAVILADVDMPVMDGIELYTAASRRYPNMEQRFIFMTTYDNPSRLAFFKENGLRYIIKPVPIMDIRNAVFDTMDRR